MYLNMHRAGQTSPQSAGRVDRSDSVVRPLPHATAWPPIDTLEGAAAELLAVLSPPLQ
jgi:hypothetical protein